MVGAIFGFAAGYMARPRALQSSAPQTIATETSATGEAGARGARETTEAPVDTGRVAPSASTAPAAPVAPAAPAKGSLLIRSTPSGTVTIDGVAKGTTPLALRDVEFGTRSVTITRRGYLPVERSVAITSDRPSRSIDVRLTLEAMKEAPRSQPARVDGGTGTLVVESRPTGASVTIDGRPRGNTPIAITDLAPGDHRVVMSMKGFVNFTTTVRVVAGERVRAAASLTAQEQE
jgi:hypothetical protein